MNFGLQSHDPLPRWLHFIDPWIEQSLSHPAIKPLVSTRKKIFSAYFDNLVQSILLHKHHNDGLWSWICNYRCLSAYHSLLFPHHGNRKLKNSMLRRVYCVSFFKVLTGTEWMCEMIIITFVTKISGKSFPTQTFASFRIADFLFC